MNWLDFLALWMPFCYDVLLTELELVINHWLWLKSFYKSLLSLLGLQLKAIFLGFQLIWNLSLLLLPSLNLNLQVPWLFECVTTLFDLYFCISFLSYLFALILLSALFSFHVIYQTLSTARMLTPGNQPVEMHNWRYIWCTIKSLYAGFGLSVLIKSILTCPQTRSIGFRIFDNIFCNGKKLLWKPW